jgi:hypothetical protein
MVTKTPKSLDKASEQVKGLSGVKYPDLTKHSILKGANKQTTPKKLAPEIEPDYSKSCSAAKRATGMPQNKKLPHEGDNLYDRGHLFTEAIDEQKLFTL